MSRIVHVALKCGTQEGLDGAAKFYEEIFGIYTTYSKHARGHLSHHMTDGNIDLALMLYDSEDEKEAKLAGPGPQIHHIGIEVDDRPSMIAKIEANGGTIYSDRKEGALKYFSPDGTLGEIVAVGRYPVKEKSKLARISHVTLHVRDVRKAKAFYKNVFEFDEVPGAGSGNGQQLALTDGTTVLTIVQCPSAQEPGIDCWGLEVPNLDATSGKVKAFGSDILEEAEGHTLVFRGPDGNKAELVSNA